MNKRGSGILLHVSSLPSCYGVGDLGTGAYDFVNFLVDTKQQYWQILPLNPTALAHGNSPYSSISAFAGNTLFVSPQVLLEEHILTDAQLGNVTFSSEKVAYQKVEGFKRQLFGTIALSSLPKEINKDFYEFCQVNSYWLDEYALFVALKEHFKGVAWSQWPKDLKFRQPKALKKAREQLAKNIEKEKLLQYFFFRQWRFLKQYCNERGVKLIGDIPIYVNFDSVDVWTNPALFKLDESLNPYAVAGVPPDYFSKTGQLWGNPVYNWDVLASQNYEWWMSRLEHNFYLFDIVRIDHFRGFAAFWEVPFGHKTAIKGKWVEGPGNKFFDTVVAKFGKIPLIAEDLGTITDDVKALMKQYDIPGMKILQFAFSETTGTHPYVPHNFEKNCVVYTGTHDNNTVRGWFKNEAKAKEKENLVKYFGRKLTEDEVSWEMIRLAMMSVANTVVVPLQDVLNLGEESRMNVPSTSGNNWQWRLMPQQLTEALKKRLKEFTLVYGRVLEGDK